MVPASEEGLSRRLVGSGVRLLLVTEGLHVLVKLLLDLLGAVRGKADQRLQIVALFLHVLSFSVSACCLPELAASTALVASSALLQ